MLTLTVINSSLAPSASWQGGRSAKLITIRCYQLVLELTLFNFGTMTTKKFYDGQMSYLQKVFEHVSDLTRVFVNFTTKIRTIS